MPKKLVDQLDPNICKRASKKLSPLSESFSHINIIYPLYPHEPTDCPPFPDTCRVRTGV